MRVLFLNGRLSDRGGADRWLIGTIARLRGRIETVLAVGRVDTDLPAADLVRIGEVARAPGIDRHGLGARGQAAAVARVQRLLARVRPDVVHVNDLTDPDVLAVVAAFERSVMTVQDHRFFCPGRGKVLPDGSPCAVSMGPACGPCVEDATYRDAMLDLTRARLSAVAGMARVTVLSRYMARELVAVGVHHRRVVHVPPFVDGLQERPHRERTFHLLAGRLAEHKGVRVALRAARLLAGPASLVVAGDGPLAEEVEAAATEHSSRVLYVGWADRDGMAELLAGAVSVWLPSLWAEPYGIVGLEALAAGVPVVATETGGVTEWLEHEREGLIVEAGNPAALAAAADRLALHPELARRLGGAGRLRVARDHDPDAIVDRLVGVYRELGAG